MELGFKPKTVYLQSLFSLHTLYYPLISCNLKFFFRQSQNKTQEWDREGSSLCPLFTFPQLGGKFKRKASCVFEIHVWNKGREGTELSPGTTEMDRVSSFSSLLKEPPLPLPPRRLHPLPGSWCRLLSLLCPITLASLKVPTVTKKACVPAACHPPEPKSRDRDWIFMGNLLRWLVKAVGYIP